GELERLAAAAADERARLDGAAQAGLQGGGPGDRGLGVDVGRLVDVEQDRGAVAGDGDPPPAGEDRVEQAAGEDAHAPHPVDVPVQSGVEGEHVLPVDGDRVVLQVEDVDLPGVPGE